MINRKFVLALMVGAWATAAAAQEGFVYNEHGKRDPFSPLVAPSGAVITYEADLTVGDMNLEGILADAGGNNLAIINGKVVRAGDQMGSYKVESIGSDQVQLSKDGANSVVKLKKGGM